MKQSIFATFICLILSSYSAVFATPSFEAYLTRYHDSGAYLEEVSHVIDEAESYILQQIAKNNHRDKKQHLAIVFDIDETTLSNYDAMHRLHFHSSAKSFRKFLLKGNDPAILPSLRLYNLAKRHNIARFFITGRDPGLHFATVKNLRNQGYRDWDGLYFKPTTYHQKSVVPFKSSVRARIEKMGYKIIASIGDQMSDINGGYANKGFKLPNPYYKIN